MELIAFADTNVFLDAFLNRKPNDSACIEVLSLASTRKIELFTSPSCMLTVIYFLKKDGMLRGDIVTVISQLLVFITLISPGEESFTSGLFSDFPDIEDAIQYQTARQIKGVDYFITSNIKDFKKASPRLPVVNPAQFLALYKKS